MGADFGGSFVCAHLGEFDEGVDVVPLLVFGHGGSVGCVWYVNGGVVI